MNRKRRSPIWLMPKEELQKIVDESISLREVLRHFGLENKGGNWGTIKQRFAEDGIDDSKFKYNFGRGALRPLIPLDEVLVENSPYNRGHLKKRLLSAGLLENKCQVCEIEPTWNGKQLVLILDHINGNGNDNRLFNLRLVCPNCNSQLDTFAGRKCRKVRREDLGQN